MKIAYLIQAYKYPQQLLRLIKKLDSKDSRFFIHIDKKSDISVFKSTLREFSNSKIKFISRREDGRWGRMGIVKATLHGIREVAQSSERFDCMRLLSGQCYPIKSAVSIHNFFEENSDKSYIFYFPLPSKSWEKERGGLNRIERYHFYFKRGRIFPSDEAPKTVQGKIFHNILKLYFPLPRVFPNYLKPYGGSSLFSLTPVTLKYILDFVDNHPDYIKFHEYSLLPDEMFFQTILLNSNNEKMLSDIVCNDLLYVDWTKPVKPLPAILKKEDFSAIISSNKLFGRKFDSTVDSEILDMIDEHMRDVPAGKN